jgi:hypothetical protein
VIDAVSVKRTRIKDVASRSLTGGRQCMSNGLGLKIAAPFIGMSGFEPPVARAFSGGHFL